MATQPQPQGEQNPLVNSTVCLILHFKRPGIKRKIEAKHFKAEDAEKALLAAQKKIVDCVEYGKVVTFEGRIKNFLKQKALPSRLYRDSTFLIPKSAVGAVYAFLEDSRPKWQEVVDAYITAYPAAFDATKERLGTIASEADRMSEPQLRQAFAFDHEFVALSTPSTLKQISAEMFEKEEERLRARLQTAEDDIVTAFRTQFSVMVEGMKAMLDGQDKDGKAQRFGGWRIEKLTKFIEQFKGESNVCGDGELTKMMDEASKLLADVNPKELKDNEAWRKNLSGTFDGMMAQLATMTRTRGKRYIETEEDVEPVATPAA